MTDPFDDAAGRWLVRRTRPADHELARLREVVAALPERRPARSRPVLLLAAALTVGSVALGAIGLAAFGSVTRQRPSPVEPAIAASPPASQTSSSVAPATCPVTVADPATGGSFVTGGGISTQLPPNGTILPEPAAAAAGRLQVSWIWQAEDPKATIELNGKRLDGDAAPLEATPDSPATSQPARRWTVVFPSPGCWQVDGTSGGMFLSVVVRVSPLPVETAASDGSSLLRRIVDQAVAMDSAHVVASLPAAGGLLGGPESGRLEGDVDLGAGRADLAGRSSETSASPLDLRFRNGHPERRVDGRWEREPDETYLPTAVTRDAVATALRAISGDASSDPVATFAPCGSRQCVEVRFLVRPHLGWTSIAPLFRDRISVPTDEPPDLPTAAVSVIADAETCIPSRIELSDAFTGVPHLIVDLSNVELGSG
jgi:hypothetical protein